MPRVADSLGEEGQDVAVLLAQAVDDSEQPLDEAIAALALRAAAGPCARSPRHGPRRRRYSIGVARPEVTASRAFATALTLLVGEPPETRERP